MTTKKNILEIAMVFIFIIGLGAGLFFLAGRWDWYELWIFLITYLILVISWAVWLKVKNPELFKERMNARKKAKSWDRVIIAIYTIFMVVFFITASLDAGRFRISNVPFFLKVVSYPIYLFFYIFSIWSVVTNKYASSYVRIQEDRGHKVIDSGPYHFMRHPMYSGILLSFPFIALFLGSYLAFIPIVGIWVLFIIRTALEDKTLINELEGYKEYTQKTKYRLFPGIW